MLPSPSTLSAIPPADVRGNPSRMKPPQRECNGCARAPSPNRRVGHQFAAAHVVERGYHCRDCRSPCACWRRETRLRWKMTAPRRSSAARLACLCPRPRSQQHHATVLASGWNGGTLGAHPPMALATTRCGRFDGCVHAWECTQGRAACMTISHEKGVELVPNPVLPGAIKKALMICLRVPSRAETAARPSTDSEK